MESSFDLSLKRQLLVSPKGFSSMAISLSQALITCLVMSLFVRFMVEANEMVNSTDLAAGDHASIQNIDCEGACAFRCKLSSRPNLCKRACRTCCARCGCVPPGTSGSYDVCPCYAHMTNRGGRRKCP